MEEIRCINKRLNKIQYYSKELVKNAHWRKVTQIEPAPLPVSEQPESKQVFNALADGLKLKHKVEAENPNMYQPEQTPVPQPDELHATPVKRKGGRPKKNQQPA